MEHGVGDNLSDIFDNYTREKQVMYEHATLTYVRYKKGSAEIGMHDMYVCTIPELYSEYGKIGGCLLLLFYFFQNTVYETKCFNFQFRVQRKLDYKKS